METDNQQMTQQSPQPAVSTRAQLFPLMLSLILLLLTTNGFLFWKNAQLQKYEIYLRNRGAVPRKETAKPVDSIVLPTYETPEPQTIDLKQSEPVVLDVTGLELKVPDVLREYGTLIRTEISGESGRQICWSIPQEMSFFQIPQAFAGGSPCTGEYLIFQSLSADYEAGREYGFSDQFGFITTLEGHKIRTSTTYTGEKNYFFNKERTTLKKNSHGLEYLLITREPSDQEIWQSFDLPPEGWIGAVINTPNAEYPGMTILMKLSDKTTVEVFEELLDSIKPHE